MSEAASAPESRLWGWEALFEEIDSLVRSSGRQFGQCEENYAFHTLERLKVFMLTLTHLKDHLEINVGLTSEQNRSTVLEYASRMIELIGYLRLLTNEWQSYVDIKERQTDSMKYKALVFQSVGRGRPRFLVQKNNWSFYIHYGLLGARLHSY